MTTTVQTAEAKAPDAIGMHFDSRPMKLGGWAAPFAAERAARGLTLALMAGDMLIGTLRRDVARPDVDGHLGYSGPPCGFSVPDFGLAAFAHVTGLRDLAVVARDGDSPGARTPLPIPDAADLRVDPLGSRGIAIKGLKLTDLWLDSSRDLSLRFEASEQFAGSVTFFQCTTGDDRMLVALGAGQVIGGLVSVASAKLINPFLPVLLVFKSIDGAIEGIDVVPFPSLVRGGLHEAERLLTGNGGDDLADSASVSATLLHALIQCGERQDCVGRIALDPAIHTGLEPILNDELLAWIGDFLGVSIDAGSPGELPDFVAERLRRHVGRAGASRHGLRLPADCIPTIAALVNRLPAGLAAQEVSGGMAVAEWNRHGRVWSVWQPPMAGQFAGLQGKGAVQVAASLDVQGTPAGEKPGAAPALSWPLAIALRDMATRVTQDGPFEAAAEVALPLLRNGALPGDAGVSALILCDRADQSVLALLESLARQEMVGAIDVTVSRPTAKPDPELAQALVTLFPDRHRVVAQAPGLGHLERITAIADRLPGDQIVILDGNTILADKRTLATLLPMLDAPGVVSAGCMVRAASGKTGIVSAGYSPRGFDLRGVPALSFGSIDPAALRGACTYAVAANSSAAIVTTKNVLSALDSRGSTAARPDIDDVLLGLQIIARGGINLCTTLVSCYSERASGRATDLAVSLPYRLSMDVIADIMASTTIVQTVR
jgi:hypothetical protein